MPVVTTFKHNNEDYPTYVAPSDDDLASALRSFRKLFVNFCTYKNYNIEDFHIDDALLVQVFIKTDKQKLRYKIFHGIHAHELKIIGLLSYWLIRLKPIVYNEKSTAQSKYTTGRYNEMFALYMMASTLVKCSGNKFSPTKKQIANLHYVLLHRPLSEGTMSMLLEPIREML